MSKIGQNLIVILGIVVVVFAAYYFFTQDSDLIVRSSESDQRLEELLQSAQVFAERQAVLDSITLETSVLTSDELVSLQDFSEEPAEFLVGRSNPFVNNQ